MTGLGLSVFVPSPSWPLALPPQQRAVPSVSRAQAEVAVTVTWTASVMPSTGSGSADIGRNP